MIITIPLWLMAVISTCFAIPLVICAKRGWSYDGGRDFIGIVTVLSTLGVFFAIMVVAISCVVYITPLLPTIMVIP